RGRRAMSSTSRGITAPDEEAEQKTAEGPWGGKSEVTGKYADVNGVKLYYEIHGTGHPLVLLHGGLGATSMFGPNPPAPAKGRQAGAAGPGDGRGGGGDEADPDVPALREHRAEAGRLAAPSRREGRVDEERLRLHQGGREASGDDADRRGGRRYLPAGPRGRGVRVARRRKARRRLGWFGPTEIAARDPPRAHALQHRQRTGVVGRGDPVPRGLTP